MNIKEQLTCKCCHEVYKNPISLNCCGDNICKQHVEELMSNNSSNEFKCPLCNEENGHQKLNVNKIIQKMVETKLHEFEIDSKYKETLDKLTSEIQKLESILKDPENYIYEEVNEFKRQVDLDREKLKIQIDALADDIIQQLETYEGKFKSELKANVVVNDYNGLVESSRAQLVEYEEFLSFFSAKKEEREEKNNQIEQVINTLQSKIKEAKNKIFSNLYINYKPISNGVENVFGKLIIKVRFSLNLS